MNKPIFKSKNPILWGLCALMLLVIGVVIGRMTTQQSDTSLTQNQNVSVENKQSKALMVEAVTAKPMAIQNSLTANGVIEAKDVAAVSGKLTGATIEQVLVNVGDRVQAGQVLAVLDAQVFSDNATQAAADLAQAQASREQAAADLARVEPLLAIDAVSRQQVDSYRTALKQATAAEAASRARLSTAENNLKNTRIVAPTAGVISSKNAEVGMLVSGTPLFTIIKNGQLEWQARVSPTDAAKIRVGQVASVLVGNDRLTGQVTHLSPVANTGREIIVHVALPIHPNLKAGMYQAGEFVFGTQQTNGVPSSAILNTDGYDYVWTLQKTQQPDTYQAVRTRVQVLGRESDRVGVDLPANTLIVANSVSFVSEGDLVKIASMVGAS